MKFIGTSPWTPESGGYEFRLSEDGTLVHLHDADIVKIHYRQDRGDMELYFLYDQEFAEGLLRRRPVLALYFRSCAILEWENNFALTGGADLSVKVLDMCDEGTFVFDSVPARIRLSAAEVEVAAMESLPPDDLP